MAEEQKKNIIIVKKKKGGHGAHGGAWKVAYADFVTAMMAFFMVMWIIALSDSQKSLIQEYFQDPRGFSERMERMGKLNIKLDRPSGPAILDRFDVPSIEDGGRLSRQQQLADSIQLDLMKDNIQRGVEGSEEFRGLSDIIEIKQTPEGVSIDISDLESRPIFETGSATPNALGLRALTALANILRDIPNRLVIEGHTDGQPFLGRQKDGGANWDLSVRRANAARAILQSSGIPDRRIFGVSGYGATQLKNRQAPEDPINRRITIHVKRLRPFSNPAESLEQLEEASPSSPSSGPSSPSPSP